MQGKAKKLKDLKAEKGMPSADDAQMDDAPAAAEEAEAAKEGEPGTPPVEEEEPIAPTPTAEAEEAPAVKAPEMKAPPPPVKTKEEPKPKVEKLETKEEADKKEESSHRDGELMHQHPKDCFLTLWPGILSVRGPADCGAPERRGAKPLPLPRSLCLLRGACGAALLL